MSEHDKPQDYNSQDHKSQDNKVSSLLDDHDPAISALYRQSAQEQPPTAMDDKIIQAAHAAVTEPDAAPVPVKSSRQWQVLGGLAASVVVALLAVELLPHALRTPTPTTRSASAPVPTPTPMSKEHAASESLPESTSEAAKSEPPAQRPAAPPSFANDQPMSALPAAPLGQGLIQGRSESNSVSDRAAELADEIARKSAPAPAATPTQDNAAAASSGAAVAPTEASRAEADVVAPESPSAEFDRIAALWKDGDTQEAIETFAAFRKRYPDYTPDAEHFEVFTALQAELDARGQPNTDAETGK